MLNSKSRRYNPTILLYKFINSFLNPIRANRVCAIMVHFVDLSPYYGSHLQIVGHYSLGKKLEHFRYSGNFLIASDYSEQCDIAIRQVKIRGSFNQVACKLLANNKKIYLQSFIISSSVKFSNSQLRSTLSESKFSSSCTIS